MILCAGEALIDMLPRDTPDGAAFLPVPGGAVFNTAIALGRLGAPVARHTGLSRELFGQVLSGALEASHGENRAALSDRYASLVIATPLETLCDRLIGEMTRAATVPKEPRPGQIHLQPLLACPESV